MGAQRTVATLLLEPKPSHEPSQTIALFVAHGAPPMITLSALLRAEAEAAAEDRRFRELVLQLLQGIMHMSQTNQTEMTKLRDDIAEQKTVIASATAAFKGLIGQIAAAEQSVIDKGGTPDMTADLAALRVSLEENTAALAAAIPAGTDATLNVGGAATQAASASPSGSVVAGAPIPLPDAGPLPSPQPVAPANDPAPAAVPPVAIIPTPITVPSEIASSPPGTTTEHG